MDHNFTFYNKLHNFEPLTEYVGSLVSTHSPVRIQQYFEYVIRLKDQKLPHN